jgi:DNA-binding transcriptional ArsR family regulator
MESLSERKLPRVELFRLLSEAGRLQLLALCAEEELSVSELAAVLRDSQPQVSRKISALKEAGLLDSRKDGTRVFLRSHKNASDAVVEAAVQEGRRLCIEDGSLARIPQVIAAREEVGVRHFESEPTTHQAVATSPEHLAHLAAFSTLLEARELAIDVGTGTGLSLDVLAPLYKRVIAVDRSQSQLALVAQRVAERGFSHVSLFPGSFDDVALLQRVDAAGGADLVFAGRSLHHVSRPQVAVQSFARLLKRGGKLVVLDYLPHSDDSLREGAGDTWLGFSLEEIRRLMTQAQLSFLGDASIPDRFHPEGPDARLQWHAWAAMKPL